MRCFALTLFLSALNLIVETQGYKVLLIFPLPSTSHYILGSSLARGLLQAGHDVTMITRFKENLPEGNGTFRYIPIDDCSAPKNMESFKFNFFDMEKVHPLASMLYMNMFSSKCTKNVFDSPEVGKLMDSKENFDVVILEHYLTDSLIAFGCYFNAPVIILSPMGGVTWINNVIGNPAPPSYVSHLFLDLSDKMNFWERTKNAIMELSYKLNLELVFYPNQNTVIQKYFPGCPKLPELHKQVALVLSNSHESTNYPAPTVPKIIDIGGYYIKPGKKLPEDLQKLLDNAKDGVVFFSLGSIVKASQMKQETKNAIIKVLGSLKQLVLWKWDEDDMPNKPTNVLIKKWFPQQEILSHPNVKLFITHAGLLSLTETIYHGVPILALPVMADQKYNAVKAKSLGIGETMSFSEITEDKLQSVLTKLISNPSYNENVKRRSVLMKDRPVQPLDLAVYWIEFVSRHKGAPHLEVIGAQLSWYQYHLIDVIAFWSLVSVIFVTVIIKLIKRVCCRVTKNKVKTH